MSVTIERFLKYVGGQMEIQNPGQGYCCRGEVKGIQMSGNTLHADFVWLAKAKEYPPVPTGWEVDERREYEISLDICGFSDIGHGRSVIQCPMIGEIVVFFPPDGSKLDPSVVQGLEL
jgi:hypothetical protein